MLRGRYQILVHFQQNLPGASRKSALLLPSHCYMPLWTCSLMRCCTSASLTRAFFSLAPGALQGLESGGPCGPSRQSCRWLHVYLGQTALGLYQIEMQLPNFYSVQAIGDGTRELPGASSHSGLAAESWYLAFSSLARVVFKRCDHLLYLHRIYFNELVIFPFDTEENICKNK